MRREYERVKSTEWASADELRDVQLRRARSFLEFVGEHSPHYRRVFREVGFEPSDLDSVSGLGALPVTTKRDLIGLNSQIHTPAADDKSFMAETSGTSGSALEFRKGEPWDSAVRAHLMRAYDWYGVRPWDRHGYLWGYDIAPDRARKTKMLDAAQNRFRLFTYDKAEIRRFARKLQTATYLAGYSSMIYEVAKAINELGLERPRLALVKGTSEMILDAYQPAVTEAFGTRMVSEYGAAEAGLIAFECPNGSMHINVEDVIVELDEEGGILVTNLVSRSFPVVRYQLGDVIKISHDPCRCGRAHPVIEEVVGRRGQSVQGREASYPALTFYYVFKNIAIREGTLINYKAVQERPGEVIIYIEGNEQVAHEPVVRAELNKYFEDDVSFELRFVTAFERERRKAQYFERV